MINFNVDGTNYNWTTQETERKVVAFGGVSRKRYWIRGDMTAIKATKCQRRCWKMLCCMPCLRKPIFKVDIERSSRMLQALRVSIQNSPEYEDTNLWLKFLLVEANFKEEVLLEKRKIIYIRGVTYSLDKLS